MKSWKGEPVTHFCTDAVTLVVVSTRSPALFTVSLVLLSVAGWKLVSP
jgi:hypothetical protein